MPAVSAAAKNAVEKRRRETLTAKIVEIKKIVFSDADQHRDVPHHKILAKAAEVLTGSYPTVPTPSSSSAGSSRSSTPAGPGPVKRDRKEYKKDLEAVRRSKETVAFNALYDYVKTKHQGHSVKIERIQLLEIVIEALQNQENGAPVAQSSSFSMQRLMTAPVAPVVHPPLPAPLPVVPRVQEPMNFAHYLAFFQLFPQFIPIIPIAQNVQINEEEEDEIIDVVNV